MAARLRRLTAAEQFLRAATGWRGFAIPRNEQVDCPKACERVNHPVIDADWGAMAGQVVSDLSTHRVPSSGVAAGTPMQLGTDVFRTVWWGGGYGKSEQFRATIPKPRLGRYWVTGYPVPMFDRRCIIAGNDGSVHELIQFDQDAPKRAPGLPQQALGYGRWRDGVLVEGRTITASDLPGHMYVWGPGSAAAPHQQGLVVADYQGGKDGQLTRGPVCGAWYALDPLSESYRQMIALGGECAARARALAELGCRITDRNGGSGGPNLLTQAGAWTAATNLHLFRVPLSDLRRVLA